MIKIAHGSSPLPRSVSGKIARNTAFNTIGQVWGLVILFFLTPYIVGHLGIERYGIWAVVGVLTGYLGLLDFGIGTSFVKYIAQFCATRDFEKIGHVVNAGVFFYTLFALVVVPTSLAFLMPMMSLMNIPETIHSEALFVFGLGIILFALNNVLGAFKAVQTGLQRMDLSNKVLMAASTLNAIGTVCFLESGLGLAGLMVNSAIVVLLTGALDILIAFRLAPGFRFAPFRWDKALFVRLFRFGLHVQLARLSGMVTRQTDKLLITVLLPIGMVTFYQLGNIVVTAAISLCALLVSALVPAFSEMEAKGERENLIRAYLRGTKYLAFVASPIFVLVMLEAPEILFLWMGSGYEQSVLILRILAMGWMINTIAQTGASLCVAVDKPELMAAGSGITIAANIFLNVILIQMLGFVGVAWGTSIAVTAGTAYFLVRLHRSLMVPLKTLMVATVPLLISSAAAAVLASIAVWVLFRGLATPGRGWMVVNAAAKVSLFMVIYGVLVHRTRLFDAVDRAFFRDRLNDAWMWMRRST